MSEQDYQSEVEPIEELVAPEGWHKATITGFRGAKTNKGYHQEIIEFTIPGYDSVCAFFITEHPTSGRSFKSQFRTFLMTCGLSSDPDGYIRPHKNQLVGLTLYANVKHDRKTDGSGLWVKVNNIRPLDNPPNEINPEAPAIESATPF